MTFDFEKILRNTQMANQNIMPQEDAPDTSETVYITPLALLKMVRHAKQGIPMEVMGLMLGTIVDQYRINVVDVFWMPQQATGITVESVDPVFQTEILEMLHEGGRKEKVVGWYHSHPGFGCWLSNTDVNTAKVFEKELPRSVSIVVDPVQSVRGRIMIEAFRSTGADSSNTFIGGAEMRQTTSNECIRSHKTSFASLLGNSTKTYYGLNIAYDLTAQEKKILKYIDELSWTEIKNMQDDTKHSKKNCDNILELNSLMKPFKEMIESEANASLEDINRTKVGTIDARGALERITKDMVENNFDQTLAALSNKLTISEKETS